MKFAQLLRKKWRLLISLALVIAIAPYLYSRIAAKSSAIKIFPPDQRNKTSNPNPPESQFISLLVYNIAHGRGLAPSNFAEGGDPKRARIAEIATLLTDVDADIVVLNKVDFCSTWSGHQNQAAALAEQAEYPFRAEQRNIDLQFVYGSWKFGNAILSKYPIVDYQLIDCPAKNGYESILAGQKNAARFTIKLPNNETIDLVPIHLEHRDEFTRVEMIKQIIGDDAKTAPILAGDFNSTPTGATGSKQDARHRNAIDFVIESRRYTEPTQKQQLQFTFPANAPTKTIDWVIVPRRYVVTESRTIPSTLSDHRPVFAKIQLD